MRELIDRLRKRAKDDQACADNSKVIVEALADQMRLFDNREGHNVYAVRMAVDHRSSVERDTRYAADLTEAADRIEELEAELGGWAPIDTAPRDGTIIDLWHVDGYRVPDTWWDEEDGIWTCMFEPEDLTHWRPLPSAPA
ncbi:hypothetical protein [Ensifer sp. SL37]|uniref:hypothetical protein n=1 Tax=Ensifer sp. SL37 TaxID=2995137 RepID=UPI002276FEB4|nr:hypothetical protein [Ensifer sp. SL37]MCY1741174.1 hypothetical protein [Ensifer sp. SL37]